MPQGKAMSAVGIVYKVGEEVFNCDLSRSNDLSPSQRKGVKNRDS